MEKFDKYIGRLLDNRYEILEVLGTGGMAVVYKARCHRLNRLVAIKILKSDYLEDEDFRRRFHAESQAVAMLSHPNIVSVYDVSTSVSMESDYIVMELIEGITLKQYMETKGFLNWKETLHFGIQIAKALDHAHSRGIVHRDIKPHNIMVLKNGSVKVTDFGIARLMSKGNTLTKEALGSVHYISPEQAKGGRVDNRSDIYSLGVVMYEMMAGRPPYDGDSPVAVAIQHINGGAPLPSTLNPNIPGGLEQIIMKAMANDTADRYTGAAQMLQDMDEFRKDPTILFDYNTPPLDAVTQLPPVVPVAVPETPVQPPRTTAERVVNRVEGQKRTEAPKRAPEQPRRNPAPAAGAQPQPPKRTAAAGAQPQQPKRTAAAPGGTGVVRNADAQRKAKAAAEERRKREQEEQKRNRIAIIAIASCALVMIIVIVLLLVATLGGKDDVQTVMVPKLIGEKYEDVETQYPDFDLKVIKEIYDENAAAGTILDQDPVSGSQVEPGSMIFLTVSLGAEPKEGAMSDLYDYSEATAISYLERLDMDLQITIMPEFHDEIAEGKVIRTEPTAGSPLEQGQEVILYVSQGKEQKTIKMLNVVDVTEALARKRLEDQDMDLDIRTEEVFDPEIIEGNVVKTDPEKGEDLKTGDTVILYISKGPKTTDMLDLESYTETQARKALESLEMELEVKVEEIHDNEIAKGKVVKTDPAAGKEIKTGQTITLYISKGAATAEMINVVDMSESQAKKALEKLELDLNIKTEQVFDANITSGNVVKTDPEKGKELTSGQTVTLYVSKGVQTAKVPNVIGKSVETAIELIKYAGFPNPAVEYVYDESTEGTVVTQSAEPDSQAALTTVITLKVSKGPEIVEDPANVDEASLFTKREDWV